MRYNEIRYRAVDISDTLRYQLREEVAESFANANGDVSHIIRRLIRQDESENWSLDSIWAARIVDQSAISVENNVPFLKIQFPPVQERSWDGNRFNNRDEDTYDVITFNPAQDETNNTFFQVPPLEGENSVSPIFTEVLVIEQEAFQDDLDGELEHPRH